MSLAAAETVNRCLWLQSAVVRTKMGYNLKNLGLTFQVVSACLQKIDIRDHDFSFCDLGYIFL